MKLSFVFAMVIALIFSVNCSQSNNRLPTKTSVNTDRESGNRGGTIPSVPEADNGNNSPSSTPTPTPVPSPTPAALTGNQKVVNDAYQFFFERDAEQAGLDYWVQQIVNRGNDSESRISVLADIVIYSNVANGDRAKSINNDNKINEAIDLIRDADRTFPNFLREEYINAMYLMYFGRNAEQAGLDFWISQYNRASEFSANIQFESDLLHGAQGIDRTAVLINANRRAWAEEIFDEVNSTPQWYQ